ncbi:protein SIEVE ELEMENT OCCLUSION B-like isoform X2 [Ipomoea triloba]|uniref:protein SIEVE ELEMENT OCCLUSION B-like isoform X2 n=1 Tax=Ipomoea triloba TaxID=35885 RepID=UPI00125DDE6B|nr:protein SIEVE ELEMENT OCCLUSION B-like isoform X2 [Ipomoea triloba]
MVIMLAAFSIIYGEYILLDSRLCEGSPKLGGLAEKLGFLRQHNLVETPPSYIQKVVVDCLNSVLELTKCVVELKQCPYYSPPSSIILALPMATYWIATTLINVSAACACDAHFKVLHQNELEELSALIAKILAMFSPELAKKKAEESFQILRHAWYSNSSNKIQLFKLMFNVMDDDEAIFQRRIFHWYNAAWTTEDEHHFEKVKEGMHELFVLKDPQRRLLPQFTRFVKEELFPNLKMRWGEEAILVSIDRKGRIAHPNVMHMILTWNYGYIEKNTIGVQRLYNITPLVAKEVKEGTSGVNRVVPEIDEMIRDFLHDMHDRINDWAHLVERKIEKVLDESTPYHSDREKDLWQQETTWSLHLPVPKFQSYQAIGKLINVWIQEEIYIFLYGGNGMQWVQEFPSKVREVGSITQLNIELVYVGRNKKIRRIIDEKRMSHSPLHNSTRVWWFWTRLQNMFLSRIHYLDVTNCPVKEYKNDEILQGLNGLRKHEYNN